MLATSVPSLPVAFAPLGLKYLEEHELRRSFDAYDTDGNGLINAHEARAMLRDAGSEGSLAEAEKAVAAFDADGRGAISWTELKMAVDDAATPVDARVRPIYATLTLLFTSQGTQFPVLPQLARSLELSAADVGLLTACTALARLVCNVPAAIIAERSARMSSSAAGRPLTSPRLVHRSCFMTSVVYRVAGHDRCHLVREHTRESAPFRVPSSG